MHSRQQHPARRRSTILLCSALCILLAAVSSAASSMQLTLTYAPASDAYDLQGGVFTWAGTTSSAPEGSDAALRIPGIMRVNTLPTGTVLQQGLFFLPAAATVLVPLYAQTTLSNLTAAAQLNATGLMGDMNNTQDQVSILSVDVNGQPNVWALKLWSMRPQLAFVSTSVACERALIAARNSTFACSSIVPLVSTVATGSESYTVGARISSLVTGGGVDEDPSSTRASLTLDLSFVSVSGTALPDLTEPFFAELLAMMYAKARVLGNQQNTMQALRSSANDRRHGARIAVAFMWTWITVTAGFSVFVAAVWLSWAFPYVGNRCMHTGAIIATIVALACLFTLVGILEGLAGFLILFLLMLVTTAVIGLAYCCLRARHRDRDLHRSIVGDSLTGRDYVMTTGDVVGHKHSTADLAPSDDESPQQLIESAATNLLEAEQAAAVEKQKSWHSQRLNSGLKIDDDRTPLTGGGVGLSPVEVAPVPTIRSPFNRYPDSLGSKQRCYVGVGAMLFLVGAVVCTAIFGLWSVSDYEIWHRDVSSSVVEFMPQVIAKSTFLVYAYDGFANRIQMNQIFFDVSTQWCGQYYSTRLDTDAQKFSSIYKAFILKYGIDMSLYRKSSYLDYGSVNEWFIRELIDGVRPIAAPLDPSLITQPADARMMAFPHMPADSFVWIKDRAYTIAGLIGPAFDAYPHFDGGSMALVRLAPQDYHRFHSSFNGTIVSIHTMEGSFHSVNADGMTSANYAIYNQRIVVMIETDISGGSQVGQVAYVAIGALCVGSITILPPVGTAVSKGDCLGYFQFGGSTIALVFQAGRIQFDQDLIENSANKVETYVQMGSRLGRARNGTVT